MLPWDPKGKNKKSCLVFGTEPWYSCRVGYMGVWLGMGTGRKGAHSPQPRVSISG